MNLLRALLASLLSLACTVAVSGFVILATLQTTILNPQAAKNWLQNSGVYGQAIDTAVNSNPTVQQQLSTVGSFISQDELKAALNKTFSPSYVKQQAEKVIDSAYDWADGKQANVAFSVDTTQQKDTFVSNMASILRPKLAALPQCTSLAEFDASNPMCLPLGTPAGDLAQSLATDAGNGLSILRQPITNDTFAQASSENNQSTNDTSLPSSAGTDIRQLPTFVAKLREWLFWLPFIALAAGGLSVLLSRKHLKAARHLAARLTIGLGFTLAAGLLLSIFGKSAKLSDLVGSNAIVSNFVEPIAHQALPAIGSRMAWVSGITGVVTLILWIVFQTLWE